ncbi:MAG: hypothetical protein HYS65_14525 [Betaproteobacteria bacterium]|nr:hypothetical protein [Betaproteobacteria bacterium]
MLGEFDAEVSRELRPRGRALDQDLNRVAAADAFGAERDLPHDLERGKAGENDLRLRRHRPRRPRGTAPRLDCSVQRATALPDVPTIQESGVPGYEVSGWYGVISPAGMPKPVVDRINREINSILHVPEMRELLAKQGADPRTGTPEEFAAAMSSDLQKWAKVVATAGIKVQR